MDILCSIVKNNCLIDMSRLEVDNAKPKESTQQQSCSKQHRIHENDMVRKLKGVP